MESVESKVNDSSIQGQPVALTVAHAMTELLRVCPSRVVESAGPLVEFAVREMFPGGVARMAIDHCSAFLGQTPAVRLRLWTAD